MRDQWGNPAILQELPSAPAALEASKFCDLYGLFDGHVCTQADGEQAYCQSTLRGTDTWVFIPTHRWPPGWSFPDDYRPVCRLVKALYGHPDAGGYWEEHCDAILKHHKFQPIGESNEWRSCYWHPPYTR